MSDDIFLNEQQLQELLGDVSNVHIAVLGDFCLDVYWEVDKSISELSVETDIRTTPITEQRFTLGGAGNVAQNARDLGAQVSLFGVIADDPWGWQMRRVAEASGLNIDALLVQDADWATHAYVKPISEGKECSRIDFGRVNKLQKNIADKLLAALEKALPHLDAVALNQQIPEVLHNAYFRQGLETLIKQHPEKVFLLDGRDVACDYPSSWHKMNDFEACRLIGKEYRPLDDIPVADVHEAAQQLYAKWNLPILVTRGANGVVVHDQQGMQDIPGLALSGAIDSVGAGDAMLAGATVALAAGRNASVAAQLGNFTAAVTVQKIHVTGTATPQEIMDIGAQPAYVYQPDKAADLNSANYWQNTDYEIVEDLPEQLQIKHIIFDHDGTLSVLREGWEAVMEPVMMQAIIGDNDISDEQRQRVHQRVLQFIDDTTGIQTLVQMQGLVALVNEFGFISRQDIRDEHGYKEIYNDALMAVVNQRSEQLKDGTLQSEDFAIVGAHQFLQHCYDSGITLYLASGTDEADVIEEAQAMGYVDLFEGRIYGAVGDVTKEAKRMVMQRIVNDIGQENASQVLAIGDGPVEIREMRQRGGIAIGIASDEIKRSGLNPAKRTRLIRAGAHAIINDYTDFDQLCQFLQLTSKVEA